MLRAGPLATRRRVRAVRRPQDAPPPQRAGGGGGAREEGEARRSPALAVTAFFLSSTSVSAIGEADFSSRRADGRLVFTPFRTCTGAPLLELAVAVRLEARQEGAAAGRRRHAVGVAQPREPRRRLRRRLLALHRRAPLLLEPSLSLLGTFPKALDLPRLPLLVERDLERFCARNPPFGSSRPSRPVSNYLATRLALSATGVYVGALSARTFRSSDATALRAEMLPPGPPPDGPRRGVSGVELARVRLRAPGRLGVDGADDWMGGARLIVVDPETGAPRTARSRARVVRCRPVPLAACRRPSAWRTSYHVF